MSNTVSPSPRRPLRAPFSSTKSSKGNRISKPDALASTSNGAPAGQRTVDDILVHDETNKVLATLLAVAANLVTAVLGYPLALFAGFSGYLLGAMVVLYVLSSLIEGAVYMFILRRTPIRFERVWALAIVVNLFSYFPAFVLSLT